MVGFRRRGPIPGIRTHADRGEAVQAVQTIACESCDVQIQAMRTEAAKAKATWELFSDWAWACLAASPLTDCVPG